MSGRGFVRPLDAVDWVRAQRDGANWQVRAGKTVSATDPYLSGHFPDLPLYPAVFLLETVRQAVGMALSGPWGQWLELESVRDLRVLEPMHDRDELIFSIRVLPDGATLRARVAVARPDGTRVAQLVVGLVQGGADAG